MKYYFQNFFIASLLVFITACKDKKDEIEKNFDQAAMLQNLSDNIFIPAYQELNDNSNNLKASWSSFKTAPTLPNLTDLKNQFEKAYQSFQKVNYLEFGPAANLSLRNNLNTFPTDTLTIENNIVNGNFNLNTVSSYAQKGFPALDYLLFQQDENTVLNQLQQNNRKLYVDTLIAEISTLVNTTKSNWENSYTNDFKNKTGSDIGSSIGILTNAWNQHYERNFRDGKIGIPIGIRSLGIIYPSKCEAYFSGISLSLAIANLEAMERMYLGKDENGINGKSFDDYLIEFDAADLDNSIKNQFSKANLALQNLSNPLALNIINDKASVEAAYQEIQKLILLIKIDLPSRLGILITYQDNDGD